MADPWQALNGDDGAAAAGSRRLEHFSGDNGGSPATPGLSGHRALAALAAELAEAAAGDEAGADANDASKPDGDDAPESPAGFPKPRLLSRLPLPGSPAGMRLPDPERNGASGSALQSTITLRKRPVSVLPVAAEPAPAPANPVAEVAAATPLLTTPPNISAVEAWSAQEDDILPRRQVRRSRPRWRRR
jgi:hypothetical protein